MFTSRSAFIADITMMKQLAEIIVKFIDLFKKGVNGQSKQALRSSLNQASNEWFTMVRWKKGNRIEMRKVCTISFTFN
jgi:hypothetical protein